MQKAKRVESDYAGLVERLEENYGRREEIVVKDKGLDPMGLRNSGDEEINAHYIDWVVNAEINACQKKGKQLSVNDDQKRYLQMYARGYGGAYRNHREEIQAAKAAKNGLMRLYRTTVVNFKMNSEIGAKRQQALERLDQIARLG